MEFDAHSSCWNSGNCNIHFHNTIIVDWLVTKLDVLWCLMNQTFLGVSFQLVVSLSFLYKLICRIYPKSFVGWYRRGATGCELKRVLMLIIVSLLSMPAARGSI